MGSIFEDGIDRRDFMRLGLTAAAAASVPGFSGCAAVGAERPRLDYKGELLLKNCNVVDVEAGRVIRNAAVRVADDRVLAIETGQLARNGYEKVLDLNGAYVIPGLIDAHCHITMSPVWRMRSVMDLGRHIKMEERQFTITLESGITTVRDCGSFPKQLAHFMRRIERGALKGPRILHCNSIMNVRGGHPSVPPEDVSRFAPLVEPFLGITMTNFETEADLEKVLDKNTRDASFLKLTVDNETIFCKDADFPVYSDRMLDMFVAAHDRLELPIVCHCHRKWGWDRITKYPVHSLEHLLGDAALAEKEALLLASKNISVVPTIVVAQCYLNEEAYDEVPRRFRNDYIDAERKARREYIYGQEVYEHCDPVLHDDNVAELKHYKAMGWDRLWANKKFLVNPELYFGVVKNAPHNMQMMKEAGVNIGLGIDAGMPFSYFGGLYREFEAYSRIGFSNAEILKCATINNARILMLEDEIGSLKPGKLADMAVLSGNPLEDLNVLKKPTAVFKAGQLEHLRLELQGEGDSLKLG